MLKEIQRLQQQLSEVEAELSTTLSADKKASLTEKAEMLREHLEQVEFIVNHNRL